RPTLAMVSGWVPVLRTTTLRTAAGRLTIVDGNPSLVGATYATDGPPPMSKRATALGIASNQIPSSGPAARYTLAVLSALVGYTDHLAATGSYATIAWTNAVPAALIVDVVAVIHKR